MSKKIRINISDVSRPNLVNLFHEYLSHKNKINFSEYSEDEYDDMVDYWDRVFPGWDDDIDVVYPLRNNSKVIVMGGKNKKKKDEYSDFWECEDEKKGKKKHNKKSRSRKASLIDINSPYDGEEEEYMSNDYDSESKVIWFYPDYHSKEDRLEFNTLKEFSDYCESMGYWLTSVVEEEIRYRYESHCCLNPQSERIGLLEVMCEHSYGEMFYEACDASELGD